MRVQRRVHATDKRVVADRQRRRQPSAIFVSKMLRAESVDHGCPHDEHAIVRPEKQSGIFLRRFCRSGFLLSAALRSHSQLQFLQRPSLPTTSSGWPGARKQIEELAVVGARVDVFAVGQKCNRASPADGIEQTGCRISVEASRRADAFLIQKNRSAADRPARPARKGRPANNGAR